MIITTTTGAAAMAQTALLANAAHHRSPSTGVSNLATTTLLGYPFY